MSYSPIKEARSHMREHDIHNGYTKGLFTKVDFLALIWMFRIRHNENSIVRESKQRKGSLDNFSFRMILFFPPKYKFENRDLSSKQTINCVERVFAHYRYIALDFYYRCIYIYICIVDKAHSNVEISPRNYKKRNSKHAMVNYYSTK